MSADDAGLVDEPPWRDPNRETRSSGGSPYWQHNPASREQLPKSAERIRVLSAEEVASLIASAIEKRSPTVIAPAAFHGLFLMSALFPGQVDSSMAKGARTAKDVLTESRA
jgi:hypothetical protein